MNSVLDKLGLNSAIETFRRQKITPDIISKLSAHEMEMLGVSNRSVMMQLRVECNKYGCTKPNIDRSQFGAPQFDIPKSVLEHLLEDGFKISEISKLLAVSERTIYRRMVKYDLSQLTFSDLSDDNLDVHVNKVINELVPVVWREDDHANTSPDRH